MTQPGYAPLCHRCSCVWHGVECECGCETSCLRIGGIEEGKQRIFERVVAQHAEAFRRLAEYDAE